MIILESIFSGLITLVIGKIIFELTYKIEKDLKPNGFYLVLIITGIVIHLVFELILNDYCKIK